MCFDGWANMGEKCVNLTLVASGVTVFLTLARVTANDAPTIVSLLSWAQAELKRLGAVLVAGASDNFRGRLKGVRDFLVLDGNAAIAPVRCACHSAQLAVRDIRALDPLNQVVAGNFGRFPPMVATPTQRENARRRPEGRLGGGWIGRGAVNRSLSKRHSMGLRFSGIWGGW